MAISQFPFAEDLAANLASRCDFMVLRFDGATGDRATFERVHAAAREICPNTRTVYSTNPWNRWNWREELIRALDDVEPEVVLFPDQDERFDEYFSLDLSSFRESESRAMFFDYDMRTEDGRVVPRYPRAAHCKAFKWEPGIVYQPYRGFARPTFPDHPKAGTAGWCVDKPLIGRQDMKAQTPIHHYCFWTREMEKAKELHN